MIQIPIVENSIYEHALANAKIYYKLTHTSPPKKRGPKPKYKSKKEHAMCIMKIGRHIKHKNFKELLRIPILYWIGKVFLQKMKKIVLNY